MKKLYVCATTGQDHWSGALASANSAGTDGPLKTLMAAKAVVRRMRVEMTESEEIEVILRGGVYPLTQTLVFDKSDSGFGRTENKYARTWPVIWRGADGEDVTISGGRPLCEWRIESLNGKTVWRADAPWLEPGANAVRQLWVNGARRPRARLPKQGSYRVKKALDTNYEGTHHQTLRRGSRRFVYHEGDIDPNWSNLTSVDLQFRALWVSPRAMLTHVDTENQIAWIDRDPNIRLEYSPGDGLDYVVENVLEALSEPGEWCADPAGRCIWYLPLPGESPDDLKAIAGGLEQLFVMEGTRSLRFENLTFSHTEWRPDPGNPVACQSSTTVFGAVCVKGGCESIAFENCRIEHVGGYGLECLNGAADVTFRHGVLRDLGAGGVKIWHGCRRCMVEHCEIYDGGHVWASGVGVIIGQASGNRVAHCHIHDFYYSGVSVGWNWGYEESNGYGNVVEWNHIHDLGKGVLSDMGGIYLLGHAAGTRVCHNHIHDIHCLRYGGWAIYPDEGSSDLLIENNLCYNTDRDLFHQHYGSNNIVRNNIFARGEEAVFRYSKMENHTGIVFERNIFVARGTPMTRGVTGDRWLPHQVQFINNLYWCEGGAVRFLGNCSRVVATQPFDQSYMGEAERFEPLPQNNVPVRLIHESGGRKLSSENAVKCTGVREGEMLTITGRFSESVVDMAGGDPLWRRPRMEVFLKPFSGCPAVAQFAVADNSDKGMLWHCCPVPDAFEWNACAEKTDKDGCWTVKITVSLSAIEAWVRTSCALPETDTAQWRWLGGAALVPESVSFDQWKNHTAEMGGVVANPLFVDAENLDFRLKPESPALDLGFVPFDVPGLTDR